MKLNTNKFLSMIKTFRSLKSSVVFQEKEYPAFEKIMNFEL